jgi:nucleotide-binding universal stress UspA family protein
VVERRWIGGSCPNINCLPSKNEIWNAGVAHMVARAEEFGVMTGPVSVDMEKILLRKREMVDGLVAFHLERYRAAGTELIMGSARLVGPRLVEVALNDGGSRRLLADTLHGRHAARANRHPATEILDTAAARDCDLIIMASHGRCGIQRLILGSQTAEVAAHSHAAVLVVR